MKKEEGKQTAFIPIPERSRLKTVRLQNIGPFEELVLDLDPHWSILLGDNGVGKSTILKAIALAICGKHAQPYADRLIKVGRPSGRIMLEFDDGAINITELYRTSAGAEIKALSQRELLIYERWLAMGFPPLRQVGWTLPRGPQPKPETLYTIPSDMIPLVTGDLDPRMTDLTQSIINFDYQSLFEEGNRYKKLLNDLFYVIAQVTQGVTLRGWRIDPKTWQIFIETDDGAVPLAAVSQGTQSLIGWVGLLLERLYEVHDNTENPREGPALVLVDEIEVHMHPRWQQVIVPTLSKLFPRVQFIATTHSPLIIGGLHPTQVTCLTRDPDGRVVLLPSEEDMVLGRADQILTSGLFGLETTLDRTTQNALKQMQVLMSKLVRTPEEEKTLERLHRELEIRIPVAQETAPERRAYELVSALLSERIVGLTGTADPARLEATKQKLLDKTRQLMEEVQKQQGVHK